MKLTTLLLIIIFSGNLFAGDEGMVDIPGKSISIEQLDEMFDNMKKNTDWNISGDMLWGYFFTHHEPTKLEEAKKILVSKGYKFVSIYISDKEDPNEPDMFWLHVEKVETHTAESLDEANNKFYIFAHELGLDSYDGMDIGPVEK